jgi:hypothetical protein
MAVGIVLGGSAFSFAGVAATSSHSPTPKASVSKTPEPKESEAAEADDNESKPSTGTNAEHPINHGFYVSQAAHCESVNDTVNNITLTAPSTCATDGQAHGDYMSKVAQSGAGKGSHGNSNTNSHANKT